jgi:hypothetical protein
MDRRRLWIRPGSAGEHGNQDGRSHGNQERYLFGYGYGFKLRNATGQAET